MIDHTKKEMRPCLVMNCKDPECNYITDAFFTMRKQPGHDSQNDSRKSDSKTLSELSMIK